MVKATIAVLMQQQLHDLYWLLKIDRMRSDGRACKEDVGVANVSRDDRRGVLVVSVGGCTLFLSNNKARTLMCGSRLERYTSDSV